MTIPKRLLALFLAVSIFSAQTAQAYSSLSWQPRTYHKVQRNKQSTETNIDGATQSHSHSHLNSVNGNLKLLSGNNTLIVGSDLAAAQGKLSVAAGGGIGIFAGQDTLKQYTETQHTQDTDVFSKQKRVITDTLISSRYQGSTLAGNSIALDAGANLVLQAAQLNSKGDTNIAAGGDLKLLSATDSTYRKHTETLQTEGIAINDLSNGFDDRRKNSSVTSKIDTNQVTRINSGGNLSTRSGGNTLIEASTLNADGSIDLKAGYDAKGNVTNPAATLTLAAVKDSNYLSVEDKHSSLSWQSQSGSGHYTETVKLANIKAGTLRQAEGERSGLSVDATGGVIVDIPEVAAAPAPSGLQAAQLKAPLTDKQTAQAAAEQKVQDAQRLTDHLNTLAKTPGQEWIAQLAKDPKLNVQFKQVSAAAQQWNYSHDGLTPEAAAVVVIVVTYFTAGAGSGVASTAGASITTATGSAALGAATTAAISTLASQAAVSLLNNKGDLGKTLDDMGKSENVKALVTAMVTAGVMQGVGGTDFMQAHQGQGFSDTAIRNLTNAAVRTSMNVAINGGSLQDQLGASLQNALVDTLSAQGEHALHLSPDQAQQLNAQITSKLGHALLGCATAGAKHQDCASGALGDVTGEVVGELLLNGRDPLFLTAQEKQDIKDKTKVLAAVVGFSAGLNPDTAAAAGLNAVENNAVYISAHPAGNKYVSTRTSPPSNHTSIILIPDNPSDFNDKTGWLTRGDGTIAATLGAQPSLTLNLVSSPNNAGDGLSNSTFIQKIDTPLGQTDTQFISNLISAAGTYSGGLSYSFPSVVTGVSGYMPSGNFNSNSFVSGVIHAAGGVPPQLNSNGAFQTPGYSNPIPLPFSAGGIHGVKP